MLRLWVYIVPLFLVYFAEYAMQSGTWAAIGFPVGDKEAREQFYTFAGWTYQLGVFISRSSGTILQANGFVLWLMPMLQVGFLVFFTTDAIWEWWWNWGLLFPCFITGLLGGAVYVNAFTLISEEFKDGAKKELALTATSLGDSFGILASDISGLWIQACLFKIHDIPGATVTC